MENAPGVTLEAEEAVESAAAKDARRVPWGIRIAIFWLILVIGVRCSHRG